MSTEKRSYNERKFTLLSIIPYFVTKKGSFRGARHGKTDDQREYHQVRVSLRKAKRNNFKAVPERFQKQDSRESQIAIGWTEDTCKPLDQIANEDRSHTATKSERQRYENNWKLGLNAKGPISPMIKSGDHLDAVKNNQEHATAR